MKWFKHDTDASNDPKIRKLKKKFGMVGYGVYFNLLELIARKMENDIENFGFLSDDWDDESLELEFGLEPNSVRTMFDYFCEIGLFEMRDGKLYNGKIQGRCDDYTSRMLRNGQIKPKKKESTNNVRTTTNNVPPDKIREEKIRVDKNISCETSFSPEGAKIMEKFIKLSPSLKYGNKTQRKACDEMISKFGLNETLGMVDKVLEAQRDRYAPRASTPYAMWQKIGDFAVYFNKNSNLAQKI